MTRERFVRHWSIGVVERCEIDSMPLRNALDLRNPLRSYETSSLGERLESALQRPGRHPTLRVGIRGQHRGKDADSDP